MKKLNLNDIQEATEYKTVPAGGYICCIKSVEDVEAKEYLKVEYDIAQGEFAGYYSTLYANKGFWAGHFIKSYKETALPFFKAFISAVEKSNTGFKWDSDEAKLRGMMVGLVLAEEQYRKNDGSVGTRLYVDRARSVEHIKQGDFKVPPKKILPADEYEAPKFAPYADDDATNPFS